MRNLDGDDCHSLVLMRNAADGVGRGMGHSLVVLVETGMGHSLVALVSGHGDDCCTMGWVWKMMSNHCKI